MAKINAKVEIARIAQETQIQEIENRRAHRQHGFDLVRQVQLVPPFNEKDVDRYLHQFETPDSLKEQTSRILCRFIY